MDYNRLNWDLIPPYPRLYYSHHHMYVDWLIPIHKTDNKRRTFAKVLWCQLVLICAALNIFAICVELFFIITRRFHTAIASFTSASYLSSRRLLSAYCLVIWQWFRPISLFVVDSNWGWICCLLTNCIVWNSSFFSVSIHLRHFWFQHNSYNRKGYWINS